MNKKCDHNIICKGNSYLTFSASYFTNINWNKHFYNFPEFINFQISNNFSFFKIFTVFTYENENYISIPCYISFTYDPNFYYTFICSDFIYQFYSEFYVNIFSSDYYSNINGNIVNNNTLLFRNI